MVDSAIKFRFIDQRSTYLTVLGYASMVLLVTRLSPSKPNLRLPRAVVVATTWLL